LDWGKARIGNGMKIFGNIDLARIASQAIIALNQSCETGGSAKEFGKGLIGSFRSVNCFINVASCLIDTAKNGVSPAPFKFNNDDEKMGAIYTPQ